MRRFGWWVLLALIGVAGGAAGAWKWQQDRPLREARAAYEKGEFSLALRWAGWRLRLAPRDLDALRMSARAHARLRDYDKAEPLFNQIPELFPEDLYLLGLCHAQKGDYVKALHFLVPSVEQGATTESRRSLAVVYVEVDRPDMAIEQANLVAKDPVARPLALAMLADIYAGQNQPRNVVDVIDELFRINPELKGIPQPKRHYQVTLLESVIALGERERARTLLKEIGETESNAELLALRAQLCQLEGDTDGTLRDYQSALRLDPKNKKWMIELGLLLSEKKDFPEALKWLKRAVEEDPQNFNGYQHLSLLYRRMGKAQESADAQATAKRLKDESEARQREQHLKSLRGKTN